MSKVSRGADQFIVRFPEGMRDRIAEAAREAGRSMNSEIIERLQASFGEPETARQTTMGAFVAVLELFQDPKVAKAAIEQWAEMRPHVGVEIDMGEVARIARASLTAAEDGTVPVARLKKTQKKKIDSKRKP